MSERMQLFWRWWAIITGLLFTELAVLNNCHAKNVPLLLLALVLGAVVYGLTISWLLAVYRRLRGVWLSRKDAWDVNGKRMVRKERA